MSGDLDDRLRRALHRLPPAGPDVEGRARRAALAALAGSAPRRARRLPLLALALAAAALTAGAGLAALAGFGSGRRPAPPPRPASAQTRLALPAGARGVAVLADGRLWLAVRGGLGLQRLPASAAALSPNARYVALGIGDALVAMAPDGRRAWTLPTPGAVVAAAWAPDALRIAYVVRVPGGHELRTVEGDGAPDRLLVRGVAPLTPSWRADSRAVAYAAADGRAAVWDLWRDRGGPVGAACRGARATTASAVAFAPTGGRLAVATAGGVVAVVTPGGARPPACRPGAGAGAAAVAWLRDGDLAVGDTEGGGRVRRLRPAGRAIRTLGSVRLGGRPAALAATPDGGLAVLVAGRRHEVRLLGPVGADARALLRLPRGPRAAAVGAAGRDVVAWR